MDREIARVERELRNVQTEEDRAIRLYVAGLALSIVDLPAPSVLWIRIELHIFLPSGN